MHAPPAIRLSIAKSRGTAPAPAAKHVDNDGERQEARTSDLHCSTLQRGSAAPKTDTGQDRDRKGVG